MTIEARNIVGANTKGKRRDRDLYETPGDVTEALIQFLNDHGLLRKHDLIWECAAGNGAMSSVFKAYGYDVIETDIATGDDYLEMIPDINNWPDWIITNPPFKLSEKFIANSLIWDIPFAFLLKSQYWHSKRRLALFREHPPQFVLPLTWRPDFTGQGSSLMDMMWCVWLPDPVIKETIYIPLERKK